VIYTHVLNCLEVSKVRLMRFKSFGKADFIGTGYDSEEWFKDATVP
jgi:hypothetical protein